MEHLAACSFANYLCKHKIISSEFYEVYVYGAELVFSSIITTVLILLTGLLLGEIINSIVFMVIFSTLRRFTGGYHANTYLKCKIITMSVFLASLFFSNMLNANWWMYLILFIVGNIIVFFLAPIENPNKPLDGEDKKKFKRLSHVVFSVMIICGILFDVWLQMKTEILFFSLLSVLIMMIIPKFMKGAISNETKSCEKDC